MNNLVKMTRSEYTTAKANRTLVCPNVALISDEYQKVEYIAQNPPSDIGICAWEDGHRTFYSPAQWEELETKPTALGVYVFTEQTQFIIHGTTASNIKWSNTFALVEGVVTTTNQAAALQDFDGKSNTQAILDAVTAGTIADAPAATWAHALTFADGAECFLPSAGQLEVIRININAINSCRAAVSQSSLSYSALTSTQYGANNMWNIYGTSWQAYNKNYPLSALAIADI